MKTVIILVLVCLLPASLGWNFPGYPGVDCPTAKLYMVLQENPQWMVPECNQDGTYRALQCHYESNPATCMCVALDGTPLTLLNFGLHVRTCNCIMMQYKIFSYNPQAEIPRCASDGSYELKQCSRLSGKCWCVDRNGNVLTQPSSNPISCY